jgi:hypothetical protein
VGVVHGSTQVCFVVVVVVVLRQKSHCVAQAGLMILLNAGITGMWHHAYL